MASVTYKAPKGDDKVVTFMGVQFFDGQAVEVDDAALIAKASTNKHFVVEDESKPDHAEKRGPGRPRKPD